MADDIIHIVAGVIFSGFCVTVVIIAWWLPAILAWEAVKWWRSKRDGWR